MELDEMLSDDDWLLELAGTGDDESVPSEEVAEVARSCTRRELAAQRAEASRMAEAENGEAPG